LTNRPVVVELDIFSGRPNPRWQVNEEAASMLRLLHRGMTRSNDRPAEPPGLGYRGFTYMLDGTTWRAYKGWVTSPEHARIYRSDTLERLLLEQLPREYAEVRARVAAEIEPAL
jgi:hypothetical protein